MKKQVVLIGALALSAVAYNAQGAVSYSYVAQPQGGQISLGQSNTVNVYLQETLTSGSSSPISSSGGMYSAAVALVENSGGTGVTESVQSANGAAEPAGFTGNNASGSLTNGGVGGWIIDITNNNALAGVSPAISDTVSGTTTNFYLLGSMTLNVSASANATFSVDGLHDAPTGKGIGGGSEKGGSVGNTLDFNGDDLDVNSASPAFTGADGHATTLAIAPEPASLGLVALGGIGLLARRRKTA